jgi:hypothetical protein
MTQQHLEDIDDDFLDLSKNNDSTSVNSLDTKIGDFGWRVFSKGVKYTFLTACLYGVLQFGYYMGTEVRIAHSKDRTAKAAEIMNSYNEKSPVCKFLTAGEYFRARSQR